MAYIGHSRTASGLRQDELEAHVILYGEQSSGIAYARQMAQNKTPKAQARDRVLSLFSAREFPKGLSILTMPGLHWQFERSLLLQREGDNNIANQKTHRTYITAIEWDEAIYRVGFREMPGSQSTLVQVPAAPYATDSYRTRLIGRYHRCRFEALADWYATSDHAFDGAWLDFSGPLKFKRMAAISRFWATGVRRRLVITAINGRWDTEASEAIARCGGVTGWILSCLPGSRLMLDDRYQGGVAMLQVGVDRT